MNATENMLTTSRDSKVNEVYPRMTEWVLVPRGFTRATVTDTSETWTLDGSDVTVVVRINPNIFDPVAADIFQGDTKVNTAWNHMGVVDVLFGLGIDKDRNDG